MSHFFLNMNYIYIYNRYYRLFSFDNIIPITDHLWLCIYSFI